MLRFLLWSSIIQFVCLSGVANAQYFKIENRQNEAQFGSLYDELEGQVNDALADALKTSDIGKYTDGMARAFTLTNKGIGVDYGSDMSLFTVGLALAIAADTEDLGFSDLGEELKADDLNGFGANVSLYAGLNLGWMPFNLPFIDFKRMEAYFNIMSYEADDFGELEGNFKFFTIGAHLQYKLIEPMVFGSALLAKWNGIDVTAGIDYNSLELEIVKDDIKQTATQGSGPTKVDAVFDGEATLGVDISSFSIPVEASTSINLLYALGLFAGMGIDINTGNADPSASVDGTISSPQQPGQIGGDASMELADDGKASVGTMRVFGGMEINMVVAKLFLRAQKVLNDDTIGVTLGLSGGW